MESTFDIEATRIPESKRNKDRYVYEEDYVATYLSEQRIERMNSVGTSTCREATWENKR